MPLSAHKESGLVDLPSNHSVEETVEELTGILKTKGITLFALVDHGGEAEKAGIKMRPTKHFVFGNPKAGTPVMLASPSSAIDLPLKIFNLGRCERQSLDHLQQSNLFAGASQHSAGAASKYRGNRTVGEEGGGIVVLLVEEARERI